LATFGGAFLPHLKPDLGMSITTFELALPRAGETVILQRKWVPAVRDSKEDVGMPANEAVSNTAEDRRMGPVAQFAAKTAIIAAAVTFFSWIIIGEIFDRFDAAMEGGLARLDKEMERGLARLDEEMERGLARLHAELQSATRIGGPSFWTRMEQALDDMADPRHDMSPEQKQKLISDIRVIAERWRPLVNEASAIVADKPPAAMPPEPK
jgi:hypothetical protein